ncbi:MAG: sialidase family protein [Myxococcota bacterium]
MTRLTALGVSSLMLAAACGPPKSDPPITCGEGTRLEGTRCVSTLVPIHCAPGTRLEADSCVSTVVPVVCATGTHLEAGTCVVDAVACAEGTHLEAGRCVVDPPPVHHTSWGANVRVCPEGVACFEPQLAVGADGTLYVAYTVNLGSSQSAVALAVSTDDGATFTERRRFTGSEGYAYTPTLVVTPGGAVLLAWNDYQVGSGGQGDYGTGDIMLSTSTDQGLTWSQARAISGPTGTALHYRPWLSVDAQGVDVVWQRYENQVSSVLFARSTDQGVNFTVPALLPDDAGPYDYVDLRGPSARLDSGELLAPYQRVGYDLMNGGYQSQIGVHSYQQDAQGTVTSMGGVDLKRLYYTREVPVDPQPSLAALGSGRRCLAFVDAPSRDSDVFVLAANEAFTSNMRPHALPGGTGTTQLAPRAQLDAAGRCHVTWLDNRTGQWEVWSALIGTDGVAAEPERVSDARFPEDSVNKRLSDVTGLALTATHRFAAWTDTRDGIQSVYLSSGPLEGYQP